MRDAEAIQKDIFYAARMLREFSNSDWKGYSDPASDMRDGIRDEVFIKIINEEMSPEEKKQKIYDYIYDLILDYKSYIEQGQLITKGQCTILFTLIDELVWFKNEGTFELTEKVLDAIELLYA